MKNFYETVIYNKDCILCITVARRFAQVLRRQTSLNHLCQASRTVVHSSEITSQMLDDWLNVDRNSIIKQTLYTMDNYSENDHQIIVQCKCFYKSCRIWYWHEPFHRNNSTRFFIMNFICALTPFKVREQNIDNVTDFAQVLHTTLARWK